jgi:hypothetical protein
VQPILFPEESVSWTEIAVQHILMPFMTPQSLAANTTGAPLGRLLPNPKARLNVCFNNFPASNASLDAWGIGCVSRDSY